MPRYFFDLRIDHDVQADDMGTVFDALEEVRKEAQRLISAVGYEELPDDRDRRTLTVLVKDEDGRPVYTATLSFAGLWLFQ